MADAITLDQLDGPQRDGKACVVCHHEFQENERRTAVGFAGSDFHWINACPSPCAGQVPNIVTETPPSTS